MVGVPSITQFTPLARISLLISCDPATRFKLLAVHETNYWLFDFTTNTKLVDFNWGRYPLLAGKLGTVSLQYKAAESTLPLLKESIGAIRGWIGSWDLEEEHGLILLGQYHTTGGDGFAAMQDFASLIYTNGKGNVNYAVGYEFRNQKEQGMIDR